MSGTSMTLASRSRIPDPLLGVVRIDRAKNANKQRKGLIGIAHCCVVVSESVQPTLPSLVVDLVDGQDLRLSPRSVKAASPVGLLASATSGNSGSQPAAIGSDRDTARLCAAPRKAESADARTVTHLTTPGCKQRRHSLIPRSSCLSPLLGCI